MNDFTKDELENIIRGVNNLIAIGSCVGSCESSWNYKMKDLKIKLKAMIDTYCEHESDGNCYTSYPPQNKCKLCGEFYK